MIPKRKATLRLTGLLILAFVTGIFGMTGLTGCAFGRGAGADSEHSSEALPQGDTAEEQSSEPGSETGQELSSGPDTELSSETDSGLSSGSNPEAETGAKENAGLVIESEIRYASVSGLNLRAEPSMDAKVIRQAEKGEQFTIIETEGGEWTMVKDEEGATYYVASRYLSKYDPLAGDEEMEEDLKALAKAYPEHMELSSLGTTKDGREIYLARFGSADAGNSIIIQAAIHAREYMTALLTMKQLEYYLYYYDTGYYNGIPYSDIFDTTAVYLIPMLNPDGVTISQSGLSGIRSEAIREEITDWYERDRESGRTTESFSEYLRRFKANANGVDLNRNFDMGWDEFVGSGRQGADRYKGEAAGSEPESAALLQLTEELLPKAAFSYHATGSILYWDYGQTGEFRAECETITRMISGLTGYPLIMKDSEDGGVDAAGYSDWVVGVKEIPAVTIEIGTGSAPLAIEEFDSIWKKNREIPAAAAAYFLEK